MLGEYHLRSFFLLPWKYRVLPVPAPFEAHLATDMGLDLLRLSLRVMWPLIHLDEGTSDWPHTCLQMTPSPAETFNIWCFR